MNIGKAIKLCRINKNLKQRELAELAGISVSYISLLEINKRDPSFSLVQRIAVALEIPTIVIVGLAAEEDELENLDVWIERIKMYFELFQIVAPRKKMVKDDCG